MPALGMAQESGLLLAWLKDEGDSVQQGDLIMEIETDKITVEIEAPVSGTLVSFRANPGDDVPVGEAVAYILYADETLDDLPSTAKVEPVAIQITSPEKVANSSGVSPVAARMIAEHNINIADVATNNGERITKADVEAYLQTPTLETNHYRLLPASPKARQLASEKGYDLTTIVGSGPGGAVLAQDVLDYMPSTEAEIILEKADSQVIKTSRLWQVMAKRMTESWRNVPHFYLKRDVLVDALIDWRSVLKQRNIATITYTDLLVKTCAMALRQHSRLNGHYQNERILANDAINIGLAIAIDEGLLVPVIHHADKLSVTEIAQRRQELVQRANENKLQPVDMADGTFTISNLGMFGINEFSAIVNPPQVAILAIGNIQPRLEMVEGQVTENHIMTLSLSCDHRAVDGARGAQFLQTLTAYMEDPRLMLS
ncbi:MAG: 2-oxo acid dehydrogenase subunit E2 [Anaerolineae bacterium]|nr:2-oxo acid dehydrogenase subunit E2 [Anaerolineae bacterium]